MDSIITKLENKALQCYQKLLTLGVECDVIEKDFLSRKKFHINVISAAARGKLKETAHSIILHDLLHHKVILWSFLKEIVGINPESFSIDDIDYPDHNRIDLSLRSQSQFLIIENKVNSAEEQPGQICRYYELARSKGYKDDSIIVLYLNPIGYTMPSLYSRSWEGNGDEQDYRTVLCDKILVKDFRHDIIRWIKDLSANNAEIFSKEPYLESAVCQYLDYLEERFRTKNEYKELHDMTEKEIKQELGLTDSMTPDDQIAILEDRLAMLERLTTPMQKMIMDLKTDQWRDYISEVAEALHARLLGKASIRIMDLKVPEVGFDVKHKDYRFHVSLLYWTNSRPYWRIFSDAEFPESVKNALTELLKNTFSFTPGKGPDWAFYNTTSMQNGQLRLTQLAELFIGSTDFEVVK